MNRRVLIVVLIWLLAGVAATVCAQEGAGVKVKVGGEDMVVIRDGDGVRLGPGGVVKVSGDWRTAGTRFVSADTQAILVDLGATEADGQLQVQMAGDLVFDFDSSAIRPDAAVQLAKIAHLIRVRSSGRIEVVGHTDSKGSDDYNQQLSEARALAVMRWLNAKEGVPADVMMARGMGAQKPVAYNTMPDGSDNPEGRAKNRRVEIRFATAPAGAHVRVGDAQVTVSDTAVQVGGTAVEVEGGAVSVGGGAVRVDEHGVHVGGTSVRDDSGAAVTTSTASDEVPFVCASGKNCKTNCYVGDCEMSCSTGANCTFACNGGDCTLRCATGATCRFACAGGDCLFSCAAGSSCSTSCMGTGCTCTGPGC